jgi:sugar phosphate isomerase/epimerase
MTTPIPLAAQLYTVRGEAARDLVGVLERIAEMGYLGVEILSLHGMPAAEFRSHTDQLGLEVIGGHLEVMEGKALKAALAELQAIGADVVLGGIEDHDFVSPEKLAPAADAFNRFAAEVHAAGMRLGYHNHWWEFTKAQDGWDPAADLLKWLDPRVFLEVDIYWLATAGRDVAETIAQLGDRVGRLHLKDGPAVNEVDPQTAIGAGQVDIAGAIQAAPGVDWLIAELDDCAGDMFDALDESYRFLIDRGLARGREKR